MKKQIPHGEEGLICPLHKETMDKVCHKCPLWIQIRGTNPNTGEEVDNWTCTLAALPMLLIENAQQSRQNGAATESFRNEMVRLHSASTELLARSLPHNGDGAWPRAISNGK